MVLPPHFHHALPVFRRPFDDRTHGTRGADPAGTGNTWLRTPINAMLPSETTVARDAVCLAPAARGSRGLALLQNNPVSALQSDESRTYDRCQIVDCPIRPADRSSGCVQELVWRLL